MRPEGLQLNQLTKYDRALCLWRTLCQNPRHMLCKQVQSIPRHGRSRDCRVCAELCHRRSRFEVMLYKILEELPFLGPYAVECHLLEGLAVGYTAEKNSLRRHAVDVWLLGLGKVLIELDGQQHTGKSYHGESRQHRAAKDAAVDDAAVGEGWWLIRITPGEGRWMAKAKKAIIAVAYEVQYGGIPRLITIAC